ncbi:hypothetical protein QVD17_22181 [Tagetes erecta]|uniref:Uncharacterized protein n=1 Tax=Tagetes erecta TaxID=13708 RepID=A0AAD8KCP6_TARER|nr:hypothetical protein QVD17_22181 [Tagetes erecta]
MSRPTFSCIYSYPRQWLMTSSVSSVSCRSGSSSFLFQCSLSLFNIDFRISNWLSCQATLRRIIFRRLFFQNLLPLEGESSLDAVLSKYVGCYKIVVLYLSFKIGHLAKHLMEFYVKSR